MRRITALLVTEVMLASIIAAPRLLGNSKDKQNEPRKLSPLEQYLEEARRGSKVSDAANLPGSTWSPGARLYDIATDLRASRVNDILTIVVEEKASAVSQGTVSSARTSDAKASIKALGGVPSPVGGLQNLLGLGSESTLEGKGETTRRTVLTATMAARVVEVLPNGNLVIEGQKSMVINSDEQVIMLRGVVRPYDVSVANSIRSEQIAQLELKVNGKGVVGDAIRRPNIIYRILLGLLPF